MSDVNQLLEVMREMELIRSDVRVMQQIPVSQRDDEFYKLIALYSFRFDELESHRIKLIKRIPSGQAFFAWLVSRFN